MNKYYMSNGTFHSVPEQPDELMHYGVKGMRWGHRKAPEVVAARQAYKKANREYSKSFNKAYNRAHQAYSFSKKKREANEARWNDAWEKGQAANAAKKAYKQAKVTAKTKARAERALAKIEKRKAKDLYKSTTDKAWKEYESTIADIEKNYKRGQNLSDKDLARESAADAKYQSTVAKAKADYKKARRG